MAIELTGRASLKRALLRLVNTDQDDASLLEHDAGSEPQEGIYQLLQYGLWDAQLYLIDQCGLSDRWVSVHTLTSWNGTQSADGGRYQDLPTDPAFLRLAGDSDRSALRKPNGERWGKLIDARDRFSVEGDAYYLLNEKLWVARRAKPPTTLVMDYFHRLPELVDETPVDFPALERPLIVAFAAERAMEESWFPGGMEAEQRIARNLRRRKEEAARRARRTRQGPTLRPAPTTGTHYIL